MHLSQAMDDPLIKFIPDMHLPKKQMKLEHGDGYRYTKCPKSLVGSSFRSYVFHSKRDRDRHNIIFHHSVLKNKNRTQARAGVPSTQRARKSKFVCPDKECMLAFSSGQALRKHLISIHKLNTCDLPPKKRGKRTFDAIEHQSIPVDNKAFKQEVHPLQK